MIVEQLFTGCLAEMAYYIESNGEVAIIDPLRETDPYIEMANANGARIKYIFLTHFHADFVSGQVDLAKKTGATIVFGPTADPTYKIHKAIDGERFSLGNVSIELLHTPGHTMESVSLVLIDENGNKPYVFTGDCLFIGDVGRPDLAVNSNVSQEDLASHLFDSLRTKIMTLPDDIIVYPNHGAGSACGKNMSTETFDTLGNQKRINYALREGMTRKEFVAEVLSGLKTPPPYFPNNVKMNKGINLSIDEIVSKGTTPLSPEVFAKKSRKPEVLVIDTRSKEAFSKEGTVPGAWFIGIDGGFAPWVGALVKNIGQKIIFIAAEGREQEVVTRFSRVGYDNTAGFLKGGIKQWVSEGFAVDKVGSISSSEFAQKFAAEELEVVLDVRNETEFLSEHVLGVTNFPLGSINQNSTIIDSNKEYYLHCKSGYRSLIAASIFKANGIKKVTDIRGGYQDIRETGVALTDFVCPSTLL